MVTGSPVLRVGEAHDDKQHGDLEQPNAEGHESQVFGAVWSRVDEFDDEDYDTNNEDWYDEVAKLGPILVVGEVEYDEEKGVDGEDNE